MLNISGWLNCSHVLRATEENLNNHIDGERVEKYCDELKKLLEQLKRGEIAQDEYEEAKRDIKLKMPYITPFTAEFKDNYRNKANALRPSGLCFIDYDHVNADDFWSKVKGRIEELGIVMAHITPSGEGFRAIYVLPKGMSYIQAQQWFGEQIGEMDFDKSCKDPSKASILVKRDYIYYMDMDGLLKDRQVEWNVINGQESRVKSRESRGQFVPRSTLIVPRSEPQNLKKTLIPEVTALEEVMGGAPKVGNRNNFIYTMAHYLRHINDDADWIFSVTPRYGLSEDEVWSTINSALNNPLPDEMPYRMQQALDKVEESKEKEEAAYEVYPEMPKNLPPLIKHLISYAPTYVHDVIAQGVFPAFAAHICKVKFISLDGSKNERAALFNICVAPSSLGKGSLDEPVKAIMKNIEERDNESRNIQQEWRSRRRKNLPLDESQEKPDVVIQTISPDITQACFNDMRRQAGENFLYLYCPELDDMKHLTNFSNLMRNAFDCSMYGQDRTSAEAVCYRGPLYFCFNASTTSENFYKFFVKNDFTNGTLGRTTINTCIGAEPNGKRPKHKQYDDAYYEKLKPYIDNLDNASGVIHCQQAIDLCEKLDMECFEVYKKTGSEEYFELCKRAVVIGYRKAMILFIANGMKWDKTFDDFIRWTVNHDMYCKMLFMNKQMKANRKNSVRACRRKKPGRASMLDLLPDTFTYEQFVELRKAEGMAVDNKSCKDQLRPWLNDNKVVETGPKQRKDISKQMYMKTDWYLASMQS
jgi:hypothetical protein